MAPSAPLLPKERTTMSQPSLTGGLPQRPAAPAFVLLTPKIAIGEHLENAAGKSR